MKWRSTVVIVLLAILAALGGLALSLRLNGSGALAPVLMRSALGTWLLETVSATPPVPAGLQVGRIGDQVGDLRLTDLAGASHPLADWRGRPLLVNVWASWCEPCRREMPLLQAFAAQKTSTQLIGLAQDELPAIRAFLRQTSVNYPMMVDNAIGAAGLRLGNRLGALPYTVLIDSNGKLLRRKLGPFADAAELEAFAKAPE
ncbi:MAG: TlpA disulfide reductase family protein [Lysobacteraceae bacterium]